MAEPRTEDNGWISAHLFYQESLDRLIVDVTGPLANDLHAGGLAAGWFFLRYWDGGNHLRLRVLPVDISARDEICAMIVSRAERYLRERPAREIVRSDDYRRMAEQLSRAEGMSAYARLAPNNSVSFVAYRREHGRYGTGQSMVAVERHFTESSEVALSLLTSGLTDEQRTIAGYSLIMLAWLAVEPELARLGTWASGLLTTLPDSSAMIPAELTFDLLDQRYRTQANRLVELATRLRAVRMKATGAATLSRWASSVARLRDVLAEQIELGAFVPPTAGFLGGTAVDTTSRARVLPVVDICVHLACNRLGLGRTNEFYLRYLALRVLSDMAGRG